MYAYIGVGSNIQPEENISQALSFLKERVQIHDISTFYWTDPVTGDLQDKYLNGVWKIETTKTAHELKYDILFEIELALHRVRTEDRNASRTIDLDLILFGNQVIRDDNLIIPDPDIYSRPFIAIPLSELDSTLVIPDSNIHIKHLSSTLSREALWPDVAFTQRLKWIVQNVSR